MSFKERLLRRREPLDQIIGFNGGTLADQINGADEWDVNAGTRGGVPMGQSPDRMSGVQSSNPPPQPQPVDRTFTRDYPNYPPQQPTMADKYMATAQPVEEDRPRQVNPFQQRLMEGRQRLVDPVGFGAEHLRELGTQKDPRWERILNATAAGITSAAQGGAPIKPIPTRREREMARVGDQVGRDMAIEKQRMLRDQGQMVPFTLPDGTTTLVPAKTAGTLASRQQGQQGTLSLRRQQIDARNKRWDQMAGHEAAQDAQKLYNSGAADDDEDLRDEIAKRMRLPVGTKLPASTQGQVGVDDQGNYVLINKRTGQASSVTQDTKPVASMQKTTEAGRERRAAASITAANQRSANAQAGADRRALQRGQGGQKTSASANRLARQLNDAISEEQNYYKNATKSQRNNATQTQLQQKRENLWNQLFQTYPEQFETDEGGRVRPKAQGMSAAPKQGRTIDGAIEAFKKSQQRDPTSDEINRMKAALGQ